MPPKLTRRSDHSSTARVDYPRTADGKRNQKTVTFQGSKRDCERQLAALQTAIDQGTAGAGSRETVAAFLARWLAAKGRRVKPATLASYTQTVNGYLIPHLGAVRLGKLTSEHIEEMYGRLLEDGRRKRVGPLDRNTLVHIRAVLHTALQAALRERLLTYNPLDGVDPITRVQRLRPVLTPAQTDSLLAGARGSWLYVPVLLAVYAGLRRGEVLALTWADVDTTRGLLTIREAKTEAGLRIIEIPPAAGAELLRHKASQAEHRLVFAPLYTDLGLVVARHDGKGYHPSYLSDRFGRLVRALGLPAVPFHRLRRGHGTFLLQNRVPLPTVSRRLGHSNPTVTLRDYADVLPGDDSIAAEVIGRVVGKGGM